MSGDIDARIEATANMLLSAAREIGMHITGDGRVREADAAALLGYKPETLSKKRICGDGPPAYGRGFAGSRVSYRLSDLAAWIEAGRETFGDNPD